MQNIEKPKSVNMVKMTPRLVKAGCCEMGRLGRKQLPLLGEYRWPPYSGWKKRIASVNIEKAVFEQFIKLKGAGKRTKGMTIGFVRPNQPVSAADGAQPQACGPNKSVATPPSPAVALWQIWTDGACEPNPGIGGWGYVAHDPMGMVREDCGGCPQTTNNRMEMTAILRALQSLPDGAHAVVFSDSQYCVNGLTIWRTGWKKKNWMRDGLPMLNRDVWLDLELQLQRVQAQFRWLRGHSGNAGNERADWLAMMGRAKVLA